MPVENRFTAPQMAAASIDELIVNVNGPDPIRDETWNPYIEWCRTVPVPPRVVLTFSPLQSPNATQRELLLASVKVRLDVGSHVAILTDSSVVRGAITVFAWFTRLQNRAFKPSEVDAAMNWLWQRAQFSRADVRAFLHDAIVEVGFTAAQRDGWLGRVASTATR